MKKHARLVTALSLVVGLALFAVVVWRTGARDLLDRVRTIGWNFGWILVVAGLRLVARSFAWQRSLEAADRGVGFFTLWRARVIGDAVGNLTAAGPLLAEPARLVFLSGRVSMSAAASALSIELLTYVASCAVVMAAGLTLLLLRFAISSSLRGVSLIALAVLLVGFSTAVTVMIRRWSLTSLLGRVIELSGSRHPLIAGKLEWIDRQLEQVYKIETDIFDFYHRRPRDFSIVCLCEAAFHLLGVIEIWLMLRLIGEQPAVATAFIFEAINRLVTMSFAFVPARMGVDEAGTGLLAASLGLAASVGVAMAVYRKLRVLFWTAVGLALLAMQFHQTRRQKNG
ncbi:MAG: lysylphosphatidylglycerol synthase domain-containing protein [Blastocatellia bacterium]